MNDVEDSAPRLHRALGFWALVAYGVGDILGAGIYALVGKIAGLAGPASWLAFGIALGVAAITALSYADLGRRFPRSGGEAYFCDQAFGRPGLSLLIGWLVLCSGVVSLATVSRAVAGYLSALLPDGLPFFEAVVITAFISVLAGINFWGIRPSSLTNIICTIMEFLGLLLVITVGVVFIFADGTPSEVAPPPEEWPSGFLVIQAAALAFFAFIGFEDMVNVAEEVENPDRNLPLAIVVSLLVAGTIYIVVVWVATAVVSTRTLADSPAPLLEVVNTAAPWVPSALFTIVALFAVSNTGLLNFIMGSRLVYGMSRQGLLPRWLGLIHGRNRTPHLAIVTLLAVTIVIALSGSLVFLAGTTSVLILLVFLAMNFALVVIRVREDAPRRALVLPLVGALASLSLMAFLPPAALARAGGLMVLGGILIRGWLHRRKTGDSGVD